MMASNLFCELFVDYPEDREKLQLLISKIISGTSQKFGSIVSDMFDINIKHNELHNSPAYGSKIPEENENTRHYYYKYRIDIEPVCDSVKSNHYFDGLKKIINELSSHGIKVFLSPDILKKA